MPTEDDADRATVPFSFPHNLQTQRLPPSVASRITSSTYTLLDNMSGHVSMMHDVLLTQRKYVDEGRRRGALPPR